MDESDEKFEFIYTTGTQRPTELSLERWAIIQTIVGLLARFALAVKRELPLSIEVDV